MMTLSEDGYKGSEDEAAAGASDRSGEASELFPEVYDRLRALAREYIRAEHRDAVLQPTALVHEAYLRMAGIQRIQWRGKTHFFAVAATAMRRILVEQARALLAGKRGAGARRVTLHDAMIASEQPLDVLAVDEALTRLSARSERQGRVAELRLFTGLSVDEISQIVGVSDRTVKQDWKVARAWLSHELRRMPEPPS